MSQIPPAGSSNGQAQLDVTGLSAGFGRDNSIIRGISLRVHAPSLTVIAGRNGSGKSTLLRALFGLADISGGTVRLNGHDVTRATTSARIRLGMRLVPQSGGLFPSMTVRENLRVAAEGAGRSGRGDTAADEAVERVLEAVPVLRGILAQRAWSLSGGQQRILACAMGLTTRPSVVLVDEPSAGLSPSAARELIEVLGELPRSQGAAVVIVEQQLKGVCRLAHEVHLVRDGEIAWVGPASAFIDSDRALYL